MYGGSPWSCLLYTSSMGFIPSDHSYGQIMLYGQCRNTTDHHHDGKTNGTDITNQLNAR